jgi:hypothetical protein
MLCDHLTGRQTQAEGSCDWNDRRSLWPGLRCRAAHWRSLHRLCLLEMVVSKIRTPLREAMFNIMTASTSTFQSVVLRSL